MLMFEIAAGVLLGGLALWAFIAYGARRAAQARSNELLKQVGEVADEHVARLCASKRKGFLDVLRGRLAMMFDESVTSPKAAGVAEFDLLSSRIEELRRKISDEAQELLMSRISTLENPAERATIRQRIEGRVATELQSLWTEAALLVTNELKSFNDESLPSISKDHPRKLCMLGHAYLVGENVETDCEKGIRLLRQSADKGYVPAQAILGNAYLRGEGVQEDFTEALKWLHLAARQNDTFAQNTLGLVYAHGVGVKQDISEALTWYQQAASQGSAAALCNIGVLYYEGNGVPRDLVRARMYFVVAAERGESDARNNVQAVSKEMSPSQIAGSDELARGYDQSAGIAS